jgi:hypothetical protein
MHILRTYLASQMPEHWKMNSTIRAGLEFPCFLNHIFPCLRVLIYQYFKGYLRESKNSPPIFQLSPLNMKINKKDYVLFEKT